MILQFFFPNQTKRFKNLQLRSTTNYKQKKMLVFLKYFKAFLNMSGKKKMYFQKYQEINWSKKENM